MNEPSKDRVLLVDDEPNMLAASSRVLRNDFNVRTANSGAAALDTLRRDGPFAVIVSDLRMPGMDGVTMLRRARTAAPDAVRILLTGQLDLAHAITAVNQGEIFRFLTKPCPPVILSATLAAAADQYRLVISERVLLEQTLHGSIKALTEMLSLANPEAFGRAIRVRQSVSAVASALGVADAWKVEVAAMLSQVGCVILPPETLGKYLLGDPLNEDEEAMVRRMPLIVEQVLGNIPRLEPVLEILRAQSQPYDGRPGAEMAGDAGPWGARALRVALDLDILESYGYLTARAFDTLRGRAGWYDPLILETLAKVRHAASEEQVRDVKLESLRPGMTLLENVRSRSGVLLISRGNEVTPSLIERLRNIGSRVGIVEPIRVALRDPESEGSAA